MPGTEFLKPWGSPDFFGVLTRVSWLRGFLDSFQNGGWFQKDQTMIGSLELSPASEYGKGTGDGGALKASIV